METSVLLVHSPLVGPTTWDPVARVLAARGCEIRLPNLTGVAEAGPPRWRWFVDAAVSAAADLAAPVVVAGHSGAGVLLPAIGAGLDDRLGGLVFVDAVVPPTTGAHQSSDAMLRFLDGQSEAGRLRPWLDWWPDDVVADLLPDPADRAVLRQELPRVPRDFYDEPVPMPPDWSVDGCVYLRLSDAYDEELGEAQRRGWPCRALDSDHLGMFTNPEPVVDAVESLFAAASHRSAPSDA
ncbi:alpha/beta fold hydrolase [Egicoccus sp. AB-alg2]|uniref:alpha/beta fold hydrolase n=1 Tax=Egicoccus sp. AB-alg2 TaxID=3242693 RepID=UPI00359CF261